MDAVLNTEWLNVSGRKGSHSSHQLSAKAETRNKAGAAATVRVHSDSTVNHKSIPSGTL
jgi:hypothetical protein